METEERAVADGAFILQSMKASRPPHQRDNFSRASCHTHFVTCRDMSANFQ